MQYILPMVMGKDGHNHLDCSSVSGVTHQTAYPSVGRMLVPLLAFNFHGSIPRGKNRT